MPVINNLGARAWFGYLVLAIVMGLLLFVPAGAVRYWQAWAYLGVFFGASFLITLYLVRNDPALLERRLSGGPTAEKELVQKIIMLFASIGFIAFGCAGARPSLQMVQRAALRGCHR
jgi:hypothetical protein